MKAIIKMSIFILILIAILSVFMPSRSQTASKQRLNVKARNTNDRLLDSLYYYAVKADSAINKTKESLATLKMQQRRITEKTDTLVGSKK